MLQCELSPLVGPGWKGKEEEEERDAVTSSPAASQPVLPLPSPASLNPP